MTNEIIPPHEPPATSALPSHEPAISDPPVSEQPASATAETVADSRATKVALPLAGLSLLGVVLLAVYTFWMAQPPPPPPPSVSPAQMAALQQQATALSDRLTKIEQRPAVVVPPPADLKPIEQRLGAAEQRLGAAEQRSLSPSESASRGDLAALSGRVDQVGARQDALGTKTQADLAALSARIDGVDAKMQGDAKLASQIGSLADKQARAGRLAAAAAALEAGQKLGELPGAPPAVQKFANATPPTESALRLSYDKAARNAQAVSLPQVDDKPFLDRVWARAQQSVTVRQGDRVLLGDPIAGVLEHAKMSVDVGDLAGAIATLNQLAGPAAGAMAPWKADAQALLDARAGLLTMARG